MARTMSFDRSEVLEKAVQYFWQYGYFDTTVDRLAGAMGLSKSSMYNTFGSKETIFKEALDYYRHNKTPGYVLKTANTSKPIKPVLKKFFKAIVEIGTNDPDTRGCLIVNSIVELVGSDEDMASLVTTDLTKLIQVYTQLISNAQATGEIPRKYTASQLAKHLANTQLGLRVMSKVHNDRKTLSDIVKLSLSILD